MKVKWPSNGSFAGNLLLLAIGGILGAGVTWSFRPGGLFGDPFLTAGAVPEARPSASRSMLAVRADGPRNSATTSQANSNPAASAFALSQSFRDAGAAAAAENLEAALAQASQITSASDQLDFLRGVYSVWAQTDPQAALDHAKANFSAGLIQSELIGLALSKWGEDHPREAWLWAEANLEGPLKERGLNDLLVGWTRRSPADAAAWLAGSGLTSSSLFNALSRTWAESDPIAALNWARTLPEGKAKDQAQIAVADAYAADDPQAAVNAFKAELDAAKDPDLVVTLTNRWASIDPAAAAAWVQSLPAGPTRQEASATLATVWAASDVRAALAWSEGIADTALKQRVNTYIATTWGATDPYKALDWLATRPASESAAGVNGAFHSWAATDPVGLETYINEANSTAWADQARRSLADVRSQNDPSGALELALGLSETGTRDYTMAKYFRKWSQNDRATAGDWLDMNGARLPQSTRERLTGVSNQSPPAVVPNTPPVTVPAGF